jgi:hypothetical protein
MNVGTAIKDLVKGMLANVHTCMPGKIISYDPTKQKASVKPLLKRTYIDGQEMPFPVITEVPIVFPRAGSAGLILPVNPGDFVLLLFSERTMDQWLSKGTEATTLVERQFSINDAIAIPGLFPFTESGISTGNADVELVFNNQKIIIKANGNIELGVGTLRALIDERIQAAFNGHGHEYVSPGGPAITSTPTNDGIPPLIIPHTLSLGTGLLQTPVTTSKVKAL